MDWSKFKINVDGQGELMPFKNDKAIDAFCNIIDSIPKMRNDALSYVCLLLGIEQEKLPQSEDPDGGRKYREYEIGDLQEKLKIVIKGFSIQAEVLILGLASALERHLAKLADPETSSERIDELLDSIKKLGHHLNRPKSTNQLKTDEHEILAAALGSSGSEDLNTNDALEVLAAISQLKESASERQSVVANRKSR
jgi:hypothetical protein